jgi:hypothetical protein
MVAAKGKYGGTEKEFYSQTDIFYYEQGYAMAWK